MAGSKDKKRWQQKIMGVISFDGEGLFTFGRNTETNLYVNTIFSYPFIDKLKVLGVCIYSIIFPRNLFFCRIYKTSQEKKHNALLNAKTVQALAEFEKIPFVIENLFVVSFIISLFIFIKSYA